jgi:hypothetical protein
VAGLNDETAGAIDGVDGLDQVEVLIAPEAHVVLVVPEGFGVVGLDGQAGRVGPGAVAEGRQARVEIRRQVPTKSQGIMYVYRNKC